MTRKAIKRNQKQAPTPRVVKAAETMRTKMEHVTPEMAKQWLKHNTNNRPIKLTYVHRLANVIAKGKFVPNHQGIAFNGDGTLIDGQHRLAAVIESGCSCDIMVTTGLPSEAVLAIDDHVKRDAFDTFEVAGVAKGITKEHVVVARALARTGSWQNYKNTIASRFILLEFIEKYRAGIDFAVTAFPLNRRGLTITLLKCVFARAFYHEKPARLLEFASIIVTGEMSAKTDVAAVTLRNWLLEMAGYLGASKREVTFAKCERMLKAFCEKDELRKCIAAAKLIYTLPGEEVE